MPAKSETEQPNPTFVFKGTVIKLRSATMENVPVSDRTAVVRVEQIIEAPKSLARYTGKDVTVQLSGRREVKAGQEMIFYTSGWIFGDSVAVRALRQEPVKPAHAALLDRGGDPVAHLRNRQIRAHFDDAHLVLSGRVMTVRLPSGRASRTKSRKNTASEISWQGPASEHDPKWREAVIEVAGVHKGTHSSKSIIVRFPSSTDVLWYKAPKFQPGQQGYFMLHKVKRAELETAKTASALTGGRKAKAAEIYTVLHSEDFQPYDQAGGIKALVDASSDSQRKRRHGR